LYIEDINDPSYRKEVRDWINSTEGALVFKDMEYLINDFVSDLPLAKSKNGFVYLYLASDNEEVKSAFYSYLMQRHSKYQILRIESKFIVHIKNMHVLKKTTNEEGIFDLLFDWYALTLSNIIIAWRRGTSVVSTFVHSAQRVSGNVERTNTSAPIGHGMGTKGIQMSYHRGRRVIIYYKPTTPLSFRASSSYLSRATYFIAID